MTMRAVEDPMNIQGKSPWVDETDRRWLRLDANECIGADPLPGLDSSGIPAGAERYPDVRRLERVIANRQGVDSDRIVATAGAVPMPVWVSMSGSPPAVPVPVVLVVPVVPAVPPRPCRCWLSRLSRVQNRQSGISKQVAAEK